MSKKPGLFSRLFGSGKDAAESAPDAVEEKEVAEEEVVAPEEGEATPEIVEEVAQEEASIEAEEQAEPSEPEPIEDDITSEEEPSIDEVETSEEPIEASEVVEESVEDDAPEVVEAVVEDEPVVEEPKPAEPEKKLSWFERLKRGLARSSGALGESISSIFTKRKLDDDTLQDLEDILIQADLGVETAMTITERLADGRYNKEVSGEEVQKILADEVNAVLEPVAKPLEISSRDDGSPHVILMIGVNGAGKTTTIGKLAQKFNAEGKSVMLAAGDTFRAAAIDQLKVWGQRTNSPVVAREVGSDAAGLAFDAMTEAKEQGRDILMIDTAGRLQNRTELMAELEKIVRVIKKHDESAPHSVLLVLDATTGQNALNQVEIFSKIAGVTGLVMTKLDGTARGGILVAISAKHKMPVHFIGVGEGVEDLEPFKSEDFARAIAGLAE
ncbi:signal recognition particle-docking protein FtsY [Cohaesibacter gelatinilyticus]|uniref:Signal recognition particle receptor FtsY n=1 Tax=Cohaesibacter gelatinilyticus TaxID=372072 RepID=A0A285PEU2_9HYPH|nr:signal recognition particle-docking protein FtsY [Cohaesibacter gelatinilyticus]SNZ19803.1 signal recognition particle-docking protein FtsY [Cohaesibacter gelatinilyticus]